MSLDSEIDKVDIEILFMLYTKSKVTPLYSAPIQTIMDNLKTKVSYYTVVRRCKKLIDKGYVNNGYKCRNSFTYYISQEGINFLEKDIIEQENIEINIEESEES